MFTFHNIGASVPSPHLLRPDCSAYALRAEKSAQDANVLSANSLLDQYQTSVRLWADEACDRISIAIHAVKADSSRQDELFFTSLHRFPSLINRGRWFFPNQWNDEYGQHKEPAYHGLRLPILDCWVYAYRVVESFHETKDSTTIPDLVRCKRMFVSEVQQVFDPRRREREIQQLTYL